MIEAARRGRDKNDVLQCAMVSQLGNSLRAKEALDKNTDSRSHAFFGPKTCNRQICISNLAERMG